MHPKDNCPRRTVVLALGAEKIGGTMLFRLLEAIDSSTRLLMSSEEHNAGTLTDLYSPQHFLQHLPEIPFDNEPVTQP